MDRPAPKTQPVASSRRRALGSPLARLVKILRREEVAAAEILPPGGDYADIGGGHTEHSVEARADAFASLFLNANPRDLRDPRSGPR